MSRRIARSRIFSVALSLFPLVLLATLPSGSHAGETAAAEAPPCQVRWEIAATAASSLAQDVAQASYPGATLRLDSVDNLYPIKANPEEGKGVSSLVLQRALPNDEEMLT